MRIFRIALLTAVASLAFYSLVRAGSGGSLPNKLWSEPVSNLRGRLLVSSPKIARGECFELSLELSNQGVFPLAVQVGNPHIFSLTVFDAAGKEIKTTLGRADVVSSPQWGIIPRGAWLGFPVSIRSVDGARGSQLDIVTNIWKLSPGRYKLRGVFSPGDAPAFMGKPEKAKAWEGRLALPPVEVEIAK